jgi:hypothetical protein
MTFNIRKLKLQIAAKEKELRRCPLKSRDRVRHELARLRVALLIARQNAVDVRASA